MRQQLDDARKEASDLRRQMDRLTAAQTVRESQLRPVERHLRMLLPAKLVQRFPVGSASLRDSSLDASDLDLSGAETSSDWDLPAAEIASILFQYRQDPSATSFLCAGTCGDAVDKDRLRFSCPPAPLCAGVGDEVVPPCTAPKDIHYDYQDVLVQVVNTHAAELFRHADEAEQLQRLLVEAVRGLARQQDVILPAEASAAKSKIKNHFDGLVDACNKRSIALQQEVEQICDAKQSILAAQRESLISAVQSMNIAIAHARSTAELADHDRLEVLLSYPHIVSVLRGLADKEYELISKTEPAISFSPSWDESTTCRLELILADHGGACNAGNQTCPTACVSETSATSFS
jgi:hypothetical protein